MNIFLRSVATFLFGLVVGGCASHPPLPATTAPSREALAHDLEYQTVALVHVTPDGAKPYCSGVWIGERKVLTAFHCIEDEADGLGGQIEFLERDDFANGIPFRVASLEAVDEEHDLALLETEFGGRHSVARLAESEPRAGQVVEVVGHPLGFWWSFASGDVAAVRNFQVERLNMRWVQATVPIGPGNSGGGLFDRNGQLIGIAAAIVRGPAQNLNLFVHPVHIREFLARAR